MPKARLRCGHVVCSVGLLLAACGSDSTGAGDRSAHGGSAGTEAVSETGGTGLASGSGGHGATGGAAGTAGSATAGSSPAGGTTAGGAGGSIGSGAGGTGESGTGGSGGSAASSTSGSGGSVTGGTSGTGGAGGVPTAGESGIGGGATGGSSGAGASGAPQGGALGAYPVDSSTLTQGGTITFTNLGAPGWWPRRLDRPSGDPACDYKDGTDTWGGHCCMTQHTTTSERLAPFDEEMTLIMKAIDVRQLAVYQPASPNDDADWGLVSWWDARDAVSHNLWATQQGEGSTTFPGDLTHDDCVWYLMQEPAFECATAEYYCPDDPGINHQGWTGSKLVVFLASMTFDDAGVLACGGSEPGHPGPWVAFVASELIRDGGRKWNGLCNCYSATGSVGDGCGEINVFEVVMDNNDYSNREFISTGVRSFQAGHVGGSVCGSGCDRNAFPADADVVDACSQQAYTSGPVVEAGGASDGCPVWRRPEGDRYFMILLDEARRTIQVAIVHPENVPAAAAELLPNLPHALSRATVDSLIDMRLPD